MKPIQYLAYAGKAVIAGAVVGTGMAAVAAQDGFTSTEIWGIVAAVVVAVGGVFGYRNQAKP